MVMITEVLGLFSSNSEIAMSNVQDSSTAFHTSLRNVQTPVEIQ